MNINLKSKNSYSVYCQEHKLEFRNQLREEANSAILSWPGKTTVLLLIIASVLTYFDLEGREHPYAILTLFAYALPILLISLYPLITLLFSTLTKLSPLILDFLCAAGLIGFCLTLYVIFIGLEGEAELRDLFQSLQSQISFVLALGTAFAFHVNFLFTLMRNATYAIVFSTGLYFINEEFLSLYVLVIIEGFVLGIMINWVFHDGIRSRFYLKSTDADVRQHLLNQLSKLVYPHLLERIKQGEELESTMPLKEGKAIVNVFDVQRSSEIRHEKTQEFFMSVFQSFLQVCMNGYEHNPLRSRAFRLKETGDGFISAIGYPFLPVDSRSLADSAVSTALLMFDAFNREVEKFNYSRPIKAAMGLAYNSVQGTFQSGGIRSYDLFGDALIQASRYEELRKNPVLWDLMKAHAKKRNIEHFHILIVQEVIYNSLSPSYRDLFIEINLRDEILLKHNFEMMYDKDANFIYFHILE